MKTKELHNWNLSYSQARQLQIALADKVQFKPLKKHPRLVAGLDCAFSKDGRRIFAAVVVLQLPGLELIENAFASDDVNFPYIPGLLSFREAPVCIAAVEKLKCEPDIFMIDGQGIAHPRRLGLASHLGLFFNKPTIGCAKSRLCGTFDAPPLQKGTYSILKDSSHEPRDTSDETIGAVLRTRTNVKPVFVSIGHKCTLEDAIEITIACTKRFRIPEPTRLAHQLVGKIKMQI
jgi:deoxyribonuclease V